MKYSELDKEQKEVFTSLVGYGTKEHKSEKEILAAIETGLVEQSLHNQAYGDGTSVGWRQEISEKGTVAERLDLSKSIPKFYNEVGAALKANPNLTAGEAAQEAQGSKYPKRYSEHESEARQLLSETSKKGESFLEEITNWDPLAIGSTKFGEEAFEAEASPFKAFAGDLSATAKLAELVGEWLIEPVRVLKLFGGMLLVYMGLKTLTKGSAGSSIIREQTAHAAAPARGSLKLVKKAAEVAAA
jgi:hypothetical protein